ncbi:MAG: translation initiation factor IF-1 [Planctomycetota bacterium]|jgi:translation initiation factor IF-1
MSGEAKLTAVVSEALPNARFLCRTDEGSQITCHVGGDMRMKVVRLLPGDGVLVEPSPVDPSKGRIVGKAGRHGA